MSNVLIGIIGVILFIGLALAGAMFLGPQFQASTANSKAAATTQAASQIASAVNLGNVQNGVTFDTTTGTPALLVTNSWLKSVPANPIVPGNAFSTVNLAAMVAGTAPAAGQTVDYVMASLGTAGGAVCDAIEKQSGGASTAPVYATLAAITPAALRTVGCFNTTAAMSGGGATAAAGSYVVYAKI